MAGKHFEKAGRTISEIDTAKNGIKTTHRYLEKLKSTKTYYVRIRTYKKMNGKTYCSGWSKAKSKNKVNQLDQLLN